MGKMKTDHFVGNKIGFIRKKVENKHFKIKSSINNGVIPVKTGIQSFKKVEFILDSRLRGNDKSC